LFLSWSDFLMTLGRSAWLRQDVVTTTTTDVDIADERR
jgi:hypothetical protein